tara:strand:+ start:1368 stop:1538 length:171 start_codon:yes stop_codon:yes gene_type:complete
MATTYKLQRDTHLGEAIAIWRTKDGTLSSIPKDPNNADYKVYLEWVAKGNSPEAAD